MMKSGIDWLISQIESDKRFQELSTEKGHEIEEAKKMEIKMMREVSEFWNGSPISIPIFNMFIEEHLGTSILLHKGSKAVGNINCSLDPNTESSVYEFPDKEARDAAWEYNPVKKIDCEFIRLAFRAGVKWYYERLKEK